METTTLIAGAAQYFARARRRRRKSAVGAPLGSRLASPSARGMLDVSPKPKRQRQQAVFWRVASARGDVLASEELIAKSRSVAPVYKGADFIEELGMTAEELLAYGKSLAEIRSAYRPLSDEDRERLLRRMAMRDLIGRLSHSASAIPATRLATALDAQRQQRNGHCDGQQRHTVDQHAHDAGQQR